VASGAVIAIYYVKGSIANNTPFFVTSSPHLQLTGATPPLFLGTVTLTGTPTTGENGRITVGTAPPYTLAENSANTLAQQAAHWSAQLNTTAPFDTAYSSNSSGAVMNFFATTNDVPATGVVLSAVSSAHLQLATYSELQNRSQFLQSISDVVNDQIPAQARWALQSEQSQL
jgi:hypothetical protein